MEYRFTASIITALECLQKLIQGELWITPKGTDRTTLDPEKYLRQLERPVWTGYAFFSRIAATPIQMKERLPEQGEQRAVWIVGRTVEFFHRGRRVARVELDGRRVLPFEGEDADDRGVDNYAYWAVRSIGYFTCSGPMGEDRGWTEVELEVDSYVGRAVE